MIKLKSLYVLLGGDINKLQEEGLIEKYYKQHEENISLRKKDKQQKHFRRSHSAPNRYN